MRLGDEAIFYFRDIDTAALADELSHAIGWALAMAGDMSNPKVNALNYDDGTSIFQLDDTAPTAQIRVSVVDS